MRGHKDDERKEPLLREGERPSLVKGEDRQDRHAHASGGEILRGAEGEALAGAAVAGRAADLAVAGSLGRSGPRSAVTSAAYLDRLGGRDRLPPEPEQALVLAAKGGDRSARAALVEEFMPLIASVARIYRQTANVERIELLQEGVVGLLRALERFDPERSTPFWAYAA